MVRLRDKDTVSDIARMIAIPDAVQSSLQDLGKTELKDFCARPDILVLLQGMTDRLRRVKAWKELCAKLEDNVDGLPMLYCMLEALGLYSKKLYQEMNIPLSIFIDTMKAFSRFLNESYKRFGKYKFDRDFWTWRQLSLTLFRLGSLEYEYAYESNDKPEGISNDIVNLHIPSDANLSEDATAESLRLWYRFTHKFYPKWSGLPIMCRSWLLSPVLPKLLNENSKILTFQRNFNMIDFIPEDDDWREWVFNASTVPIGQLEAKTSLQKSMKLYLLKGGLVGVGIGRLRTDSLLS